MWGNVFVFVEGRIKETWVHLISDLLLILDLIHTVLYNYEEHGSKNHPGGIMDFRAENKSVQFYAVPQNTPKCLVFLLNLYLKRLPKYAFENNLLYLRPKPKCPSDPDIPWYEDKPVGRNSLNFMMKDMSAEVGISSKTNHSLRATGATNLFHANVPERIIQKTTGHKSLEALRCYERVSEDQHKSVSQVLMLNSSYTPPAHQAQASVQGENIPAVEETRQKSLTVHARPDYGMLSKVLGDMTNCSIGHITVNVNPTIYIKKTEKEIEDEFDALAKYVQL